MCVRADGTHALCVPAQYLGKPKEKKKVLKPADKFKFLFDWEPVRLTKTALSLVMPSADSCLYTLRRTKTRHVI